MARISYYYFRKGCQSCKKMDATLGQDIVSGVEKKDVRKNPIDSEEIVSELEGLDFERVVVAKGKKVLEFAKDAVEENVKGFTGRSGKLRSPVLLLDKTLFVGFNDNVKEKVSEVLGNKKRKREDDEGNKKKMAKTED